MKNIILTILCLFGCTFVAVQAQTKRFTISGHISDIDSGETLIGAAIVSQDNNSIGAITNEFGYYSLTMNNNSQKRSNAREQKLFEKEVLDSNALTFSFSYLGYETQVIQLSSPRDTVINISLKSSNQLAEAVVTARKDAGFKSQYLGSIDVPLVHIRQTPMILGEADVLKSLQLLPGVQGGSEGFNGLFVRGGGPDENLVMLDGVPLYNIDHTLGIFSVFQTEAVKKVSLYKGSFPARYSGRVSSIVDIRTVDGNMKEYHGSITLGIVSNKIHIEGPIAKDRLSFSLSARGMMSAFYGPIIKKLSADGGSNYYFYDINGKLTWRANERNRFYLSSYIGADVTDVEIKDSSIENGVRNQSQGDAQYSWGNRIVSLRWNHIFSPRLFSNATVSYNHYNMGLKSQMGTNFDQEDRYANVDVKLNYGSGIRDVIAKIDFEYKPNANHTLLAGANYTYHNYCPEIANTFISGQSSDATSALPVDVVNFNNKVSYNGHEASVYVEENVMLFDWLSLNPGLHLSFFNTGKKNYLSLQPRVNTKFDLSEGYSLKAGYSRMAQYVHLLTSSSINLPMDLWVPITSNIRPVISDQYSIGFYVDALRDWEFSLESYLKLTSNILEYKEGTTAMMGGGGNWENNVAMGQGRAYGVELMAEKKYGKVTGWVSYALAKSERIFPDGSINLGRWFPYKYDRRHAINICANYKINSKVETSLTWQFASGGATTISTNKSVILDAYGNVKVVPEVTERNNYRLPASHHLNLGVSLHHPYKRGEGVWNFSIYNVYNQKNPNFIFASTSYDDFKDKATLTLAKITILPILPAISYTRSF